MPQQTSTFKISYDINQTSDHTIDAELLGESIASTAKLIKNTNKLLNGEESDLSVEVKAPAEGSVVVEFVTSLNAVGINPLSTLGFVGAAVAGSSSVMVAIKELRSREVILVEESVDNSPNTKLKLKDNSIMELPPAVATVILNNDIRKSLNDIVAQPMLGADSGNFVVKDEHDAEVLRIPAVDTKFYKKPKKITVDRIEETTETKDVYFTKVNFEGVTGWQVKLPDGNLVSVKMSDEAFIERINQNSEQFSKESLFSVELNIVTTYRHGSSPRYDREITRVIRHRAYEENKII